MIEQYLEDLESRICDETEEDLFEQWRGFVDHGTGSGLFEPKRKTCAPSTISWPAVAVNEALDSFGLMGLQQFETCSRSLASGDGGLLCIRANFGTGILPTILGARLYVMPSDTNTLPTALALEGGVKEIWRVVDRGVPDLANGLGGRVFETGQLFVSLLKDYPRLQRYVHIYHPDLQGPFDVCELLWGSSIFLALVDEPLLVKELLDVITETYIAFMRRWDELVPALSGYAVHWSMLHKGRIMLRDDSAMNLSPEMFAEFIRPHDQKLLAELGGGAMHFCGKGDHFIGLAGEMPGLYSVNLSQPHLNDMERVYQNTVDKGIRLLAMTRAAAEQGLGRNTHGYVHCC